MKIKALKLLTLVCLLIACALPVLFLSGRASSEPDPSLAGIGLGSLETFNTNYKAWEAEYLKNGGDKNMVLMALATIRAETGNFTPLSEFQSKFNTPPGGPPFALYDNRTDLGNQGPPDGANFRGRGYIQLTGRSNYAVHGAAIGLGNQLVTNPALANQPDIAGKLLASFLKAHESGIRAALARNDLATARRLVNGGSHGLQQFTDAFNIGKTVIT